MAHQTHSEEQLKGSSRVTIPMAVTSTEATFYTCPKDCELLITRIEPDIATAETITFKDRIVNSAGANVDSTIGKITTAASADVIQNDIHDKRVLGALRALSVTNPITCIVHGRLLRGGITDY